MRHFILAALVAFALCAAAQNPKREFRGAWMHTVGQSQYASQSTEENKRYLRQQLDMLQSAGVNAVIFQVRPCADAFYRSKYELWSKFLTGDCSAPKPYWDPLQFMVEEAHARGMELHAWLNPYRVTTAKADQLPKNHLYHREKWRFVRYAGDGKIYFDPAIPQNREYIAKVVMDIVENYDVDAIHFDDYFYPYPVKKIDFPDAASYAKYGKGMNKGDWRRKNVDLLIELIHNKLRQGPKPWVRFGISPFGIWRNKASDPRGSDTNGLQNYDDLYADVLLWAEKGWIDYLVPQLYWELEHKAASYLKLVDWWAKAVDPKCHVYIGQSVERSMNNPDLAPSDKPNQLHTKVDLTRRALSIQGNCWWPAYSLTRNFKDAATILSSTYQSTPALVPAYPSLASDAPQPVKKVQVGNGSLSWAAPKCVAPSAEAVRYVVYRFDFDADKDYDNAANIVAVTPSTSLAVSVPGIYAVTAVDRVNNESDPVEITVRQAR